MWQIFGRTHSVAVSALILAATALTGGEALAQATTQNFVNQNISGFNLPGVTLPQGSDEVRAADGTTCRSAVGGNGAYVDVGVIGNPEQNNTNGSLSAYTRVVIPLGANRGRLDCRKLYDLEVRRLEIELKLMELGLNRGIGPVSETAEVSIDSTSTATANNGEGKTPSSQASNEAATTDVASADVKSIEAEAGGDWATDGWTTDGRQE